MTWHAINCGDPTLCDPVVQKVLQTYERVSSTDHLPPGAAIYSRHESRGDLHCELILYFTSEAAVVAQELGAIACNEPAPQGLSLLVNGTSS
jgi:hypothetical protein